MCCVVNDLLISILPSLSPLTFDRGSLPPRPRFPTLSPPPPLLVSRPPSPLSLYPPNDHFAHPVRTAGNQPAPADRVSMAGRGTLTRSTISPPPIVQDMVVAGPGV